MAGSPPTTHQRLYHHETLDVYGAALDLVRWMTGLPGAKDLPSRFHRQVDEGVTGPNIAEGNGRYSELDHRRFLDLAAGAAVKVAAGLDLATRKTLWDSTACEALMLREHRTGQTIKVATKVAIKVQGAHQKMSKLQAPTHVGDYPTP